MPAIKILFALAPAAATPMTRLAGKTIPSFAPRTAARSHPIRPILYLSIYAREFYSIFVMYLVTPRCQEWPGARGRSLGECFVISLRLIGALGNSAGYGAIAPTCHCSRFGPNNMPRLVPLEAQSLIKRPMATHIYNLEALTYDLILMVLILVFQDHYGWPIQVSRSFVLLDIISCTVPATMC